jgi:hypothetical protein
MPRRPLHYLTLIGICGCTSLLETSALALSDDPFPGNIFELRPPHVRLSEPGESASHPRGGQTFPFDQLPPAVPPQDEVILTERDSLTLVYPSEGGRYSSGEFELRDRLRIDGNELALDIFQIPIFFSGDALVPPAESGIFLGQLPAGEYNVSIRHWYLPPAVFPWLDPGTIPEFDPETFEPPANTITFVPPPIPPTGVYATFQPPYAPGDPPVVVPSSFQFTVFAVPEPGTFAATVLAVFCFAGIARIGKRRPL